MTLVQFFNNVLQGLSEQDQFLCIPFAFFIHLFDLYRNLFTCVFHQLRKFIYLSSDFFITAVNAPFQ